MSNRKREVIVIKEEDMPKVRKKYAPLTQIVADATKYSRKQKHKKARLDDHAGFFVCAARNNNKK